MDGIRNCGVTPADDLYAYLGCARTAYQTDVRKGFRLWAIRYHPGKNSDKASFEVFRKVCNAYEVLGDEDRKDKFDRYGLHALGWDNGFSFGEPVTVFNNFFRHYGGLEVVSKFLQTPNGSGWEGYGGVWGQITSAMPKLSSGMSCCGDFAPQGGTTVPCTPSGPGVTSNISAVGAADRFAAGGGSARDSFYSSALGNMRSTGGHKSYTPAEGTMKHQYMAEYRKRRDSLNAKNGVAAGATPTKAIPAVPGVGAVESPETDALVDYSYVGGFGMPAKDTALAEFRRSSLSRDIMAPSGRRPNAYELRMQQMADQNADMNAKGSFLDSYQKKRTPLEADL